MEIQRFEWLNGQGISMARLYCQNSTCQIESQHSKMSAISPIQSSNRFYIECHFLVADGLIRSDTFQID